MRNARKIVKQGKEENISEELIFDYGQLKDRMQKFGESMFQADGTVGAKALRQGR